MAVSVISAYYERYTEGIMKKKTVKSEETIGAVNICIKLLNVENDNKE